MANSVNINHFPAAGCGRRWLWLGGLIFASLALNGVIARLLQPAVKGWYQTIAKPWFVPPDPVFAIVWATLFLMMAVAFWSYIQPENRHKSGFRAGFWLFVDQYILCCLWPIGFFGLHSTLMGMIGTMLMWPFIMLTIWAFARIDRMAAWLMVPYALWVTMALVMSVGIFVMN